MKYILRKDINMLTLKVSSDKYSVGLVNVKHLYTRSHNAFTPFWLMALSKEFNKMCFEYVFFRYFW